MSEFPDFCPKRVVGHPSRGFRDSDYVESLGKRCFALFFVVAEVMLLSPFLIDYVWEFRKSGDEKCRHVITDLL